MEFLAKFFEFERHQTTVTRELIAGLTTFTTMSYIVVVNPAILSNAGIPEGPAFVSTILVAVAGCYLMAFYANRPFAIAPYMGENALICDSRLQNAFGGLCLAAVLLKIRHCSSGGRSAVFSDWASKLGGSGARARIGEVTANRSREASSDTPTLSLRRRLHCFTLGLGANQTGCLDCAGVH